MKIVFNGSSSDSSSSPGELGDEIVQPRASNRSFSDSNESIRMRGTSMNALWGKNQKRFDSKVDDDAADLIKPPTISDGDEPILRISHSRIDLAASDSSLDEQSLAKFKKAKHQIVAKAVKPKPIAKQPPVKIAKIDKPTTHAARKAATPQQVAITIPPEETPREEVKNVPAKTPARPVTRTYVKNKMPVATENHLATSARSDEPSDFKFNFAFETTVTMGRKYELETTGDRTYAMKNEAFLGVAHTNGWGLKLSADYVTSSNDDSKKDVQEMGDPSVIVSHPTIYKDQNVDVYGRFRYYMPVAASSRAANLQHFAYYLLTDVQLPAQMIVSNSFVIRYFEQSSYLDSDAFSLVRDSTELTKKLNLVCLGLGQRTRIESHQAIAPGTAAEVYPFADFLGLPNALLEAKVYLPVFAKGIVSGGPSAASISNIQAEFFMKLSW